MEDVKLITIISSAVIFLIVTLVLVVILLVAKRYLVASGKAKVDINSGKKELDVNVGSTLLSGLSEQGVFLASACGGKGSCAQCRVRVTEGGGEILPTSRCISAERNNRQVGD
jgi:Na+-transporting NADH:ubiquinone oxidoreductase subunit F